MIELEIPGVSSGHESLYFEDKSPEGRKNLGERVNKLLREGCAAFLVEGEDSHLIKGYDAETNEFLLRQGRQAIPRNAKTLDSNGKRSPFKPTRIKATGKKVTVVAPGQGG